MKIRCDNQACGGVAELPDAPRSRDPEGQYRIQAICPLCKKTIGQISKNTDGDVDLKEYLRGRGQA
jgi:hypothetical protein